jgi:GTPase SAR1 family protein
MLMMFSVARLMMSFVSKTDPRIYSLLSIGQRGTGKTVFLAGGYAELHSQSQKDTPQPFWFDCEDSETQQTIENTLGYVARTGQYPPATIKISNFDFSLKQRSLLGVETLCHFSWWDTPGESCHLYNPAFLAMILNSDGYSMFLDANILVQQSDNPQAIESLIRPIRAIAEVVYDSGLKSPLAIILTKCDLFQAELQSRQNLEEHLQPLKARLDSMAVNYQIFYSAIPIVSTEKAVTLQARQAADSILWLLSEIRKSHTSDLIDS